MENNVFAKFNEMFDLAGLQQDIDKASAATGDFEPVPYGDYEVRVVKLEVGESKKGMPMGKIWFDIIGGEHKGQKIFMNQMLTSGFGIHKMNEFLNSLETGMVVQFENFTQYADLFKQIFAEIDGKAEYHLCYGERKGFGTYDIIKRF